MEAKANARYIKMSPRKVRVVANLVRGKDVGEAIKTLSFVKRSAATPLKKVLESAIANAEHNDGADIDELKVSQIFIDQGPTLKRLRPRARGRADRLLKPTSHIMITVSEQGK